MIKSSFITASGLKKFRAALSFVVRNERAPRGDQSDSCFGSLYLRYLIDKHKVFFDLFKSKVTLSIAQSVLGPQIKFDEITARITDLSTNSASTPWHIHHRVIPEPLPPFFVHPHSVECLLYLDNLDQETGPLCVLPGSHRHTNMIYPLNDSKDKPGQQILCLKAGDCLIMHPNLWHRGMPSMKKSGLRSTNYLWVFAFMAFWRGAWPQEAAKRCTESNAASLEPTYTRVGG